MLSKALNLIHIWSLLLVVYGRILLKVLRDTQVHLKILEGRTLLVSTLGGCTHARFPCRIWKRTLNLRFSQETRNMALKFDLHEWLKEISLVSFVTRTLTAGRLCPPSTYKLNAEETYFTLTSSVHQLIRACESHINKISI